jgi:hypothetical protein
MVANRLSTGEYARPGPPIRIIGHKAVKRLRRQTERDLRQKYSHQRWGFERSRHQSKQIEVRGPVLAVFAPSIRTAASALKLQPVFAI